MFFSSKPFQKKSGTRLKKQGLDPFKRNVGSKKGRLTLNSNKAIYVQ